MTPSASSKKNPSLNPISFSFHKGEPSLKIPQTLVDAISKLFRFALIGMISHGQPSMERSRQIFSKLGLKGIFSLRHLDPKHMFIQIQYDGDFNRLWLNEVWFLISISVFKWTLDCRPYVESSIALVWISLPNLCIFLFDKQCLQSIGSLIGWPLTQDSAMADFSRPSVVRICVEINVLKILSKRIWLECGNPGFWQEITYKKLPYYCKYCRWLSHDIDTCKLAYPELARKPERKEKEPVATKKIFKLRREQSLHYS